MLEIAQRVVEEAYFLGGLYLRHDDRRQSQVDRQVEVVIEQRCRDRGTVDPHHGIRTRGPRPVPGADRVARRWLAGIHHGILEIDHDRVGERRSSRPAHSAGDRAAR